MSGFSAVMPPPAGADSLGCASPADLARARRLVRRRGAGAGLDEEVVADLVLAVNEVLTNALVHGGPPVLLHLYPAGDTWVCHVQDGGRVALDPLTGTTSPAALSEDGYGLWLARQLCADVDISTHASGTHVRLHMPV